MSWFNLGRDDPDGEFNIELKRFYERLNITKFEAEKIPPDYDDLEYDDDIKMELICPMDDHIENRGRKINSLVINSKKHKDILKPISIKTRKLVFNKAGNICEYCSKHQCMEVHHKDGDPSNDSVENYMAVCANCHSKLDIMIRNKRRL